MTPACALATMLRVDLAQPSGLNPEADKLDRFGARLRRKLIDEGAVNLRTSSVTASQYG